jgi:hypothetical protein
VADPSVAIVGYRVPVPVFDNLVKYRDLNIARVPFYQAWGVFSLLTDTAICGSSTSLPPPLP